VRSIHCPSNGDAQVDIMRFELTLRCRGVQLDGMLGKREQDLLRDLAARQ
jgi:hypothetical protein